jgi:hypothetical protein
VATRCPVDRVARFDHSRHAAFTDEPEKLVVNAKGLADPGKTARGHCLDESRFPAQRSRSRREAVMQWFEAPRAL